MATLKMQHVDINLVLDILSYFMSQSEDPGQEKDHEILYRLNKRIVAAVGEFIDITADEKETLKNVTKRCENRMLAEVGKIFGLFTI